jgi:mRNA-degrading endonuclease RelE of RelBE toxin-antitoxin system
MPTKVVIADQFLRDARKLQKDYPHILQDVRALRMQLEADEKPGDRIKGLEYAAFKVRVKNSDVQRGKSGGYRVIYYLEMSDQVVLITIYSKSKQSDIPLDKLRRFISEYEAQNPPTQ